MKFRYKKPTKLNYKGTQYRQGDIIEMDKFDNRLPANWFELVEETEKSEVIEKTETNKPKKEVDLYGYSKKSNKDLGSKRR